MLEVFIIFGKVNIVELSALVALITAVVGAIIAVVKLPTDRGTLRITKEQGSMMMRDNFISALQRELERKNVDIDRLERKSVRLEDEVDELETLLRECREARQSGPSRYRLPERKSETPADQ